MPSSGVKLGVTAAARGVSWCFLAAIPVGVFEKHGSNGQDGMTPKEYGSRENVSYLVFLIERHVEILMPAPPPRELLTHHSLAG
jgi:hypothetical protein